MSDSESRSTGPSEKTAGAVAPARSRPKPARASQFEVRPFKGGFAVYRRDELLTRTNTREVADEYVDRHTKGS